jgi:hypothetical protein
MTQAEIKSEIDTLKRMFEQLPSDLCQLFTDQLNVVIRIINDHNAITRDHINEQLDDIRLAVKTMQFDLEATRTEKQTLADKLRDAGLE